MGKVVFLHTPHHSSTLKTGIKPTLWVGSAGGRRSRNAKHSAAAAEIKKRNGCERIKNKSVRGVWERCVLSARCGILFLVDGPREIRGLKRPGGVRQGSIGCGQAAAAALGAGAAARSRDYRFGCGAAVLGRAVPEHRIGSPGASGRRDCSPEISHCSERAAVFRSSNQCSHIPGQIFNKTNLRFSSFKYFYACY